MLYLSKSKYCNAVQCPKMLWLDKNKPEEKDDSNSNESIKARGDRVGDLAMSYFGDYIEIEYCKGKDKSPMLEATKREMEKGTPVICEATFSYEGLFCSVDILKKADDGTYEIYEVKSTSKVEDKHKPDIAYQYYVLTKLGIPVSKVYLMHIDPEYVRNGDLDVTGLFDPKDKTDVALEMFDEVDSTIKKLASYMQQEEEPEMPLGRQCFKPYDCTFFKYCSRNLPVPNVFDLAEIDIRVKKKLYDSGKVAFDEACEGLKRMLEEKPNLTKVPKAIFQIETALSDNDTFIDKDKVREFLDKVTYPIYMLDFEYYRNPVPEFDGVKVNALMTFQYSIHIIDEDGTVEHREFLAEAGKDPRRAVAEQLCRDIPKNVCVMAYHQSAEASVLESLAITCPDLADHLLTIKSNLKDLEDPFRERYYYTNAMDGRYSIKLVLPALFPDDPGLDYSNLDGVNKGDKASEAFMAMATLPPADVERLRHELLEYCKLDTYAMVKVWQKLKEVTE